MPTIWGHVESVVNQPKSPQRLVLSTRATFGTRRTKCIVGVGARILKGFERLNLDEICPGDFVIATIAKHSGWLEAQRIEVIVFRSDSVMGVGEGSCRPTPTSYVRRAERNKDMTVRKGCKVVRTGGCAAVGQRRAERQF